MKEAKKVGMMIIGRVPIASVKIAKGRKDPKQERIDALASSIAEIGLLEPIGVTGAKELVYGLTRLRACASLGWTEINAVTVSLQGLEVDLARVDENLCQSDRTALERAELVKEREAIYHKLHPDAPKTAGRPAQVAAGKGEIIPARAPSFPAATAAATGMSETAIQRDLKIGKGLDPEAKEEIRGTPTADSKAQLLDLAREKPAKQRKIAKAIKEGKVKSVGEATGKKPAKPKKPRPPKEEDEDTANAKIEILRLYDENDKLRDKIKALSANDAKKETAKWVDKYQRLSGEVKLEMKQHEEAKKQATYYGGILKKVAKILEVESYSKIVSALNDAFK